MIEPPLGNATHACHAAIVTIAVTTKHPQGQVRFLTTHNKARLAAGLVVNAG
jgi:hypothetical protein